MAQMEKDWRTDYNWMDPNDLPVTDDDLDEPIRDIDLEKMIGVPGSGEQSGIMSAAENTDMAGMGKVMQMFQSDYGFDRDGFEENYIQFLDYRDKGGDMGIVEFTLNAFDMVKKQEKAPSIKMASETPEEEFDLMQMQEEMQLQEELKKQLEKDREQAMYGGSMRTKYATGTPESSKIEALLKGLKSTAENFPDPFIKEAVTLEALIKKFKGKDKIPERQSRMEKEYPESMKKKYNFMELVDSSNDDVEEELMDRKYNAKNYPPSQRGMSMEEFKKMLDKAKKDKEKKAKGGIAGVL
jgi:hypothetical protein